MNGVFALLERSLRVDARAWSTHLARLGLLGTIYFSLGYAQLTSFMFGAPGLHFFQGIAYLDATFMTLLGIGFFSTAITEEKEEDTLGLMLMAGISPLGILVGKSGGRLWQALLLIGVQFPFVLLAVTMGGIMPSQIWAVTISLLAYMIFLAGFGLLCSTLALRSQTAAKWMIVGLVLYVLIPVLAQQWSTAQAMSAVAQGKIVTQQTLLHTLVEGIGHLCIFSELGQILATGFAETAFGIQVISNTLIGVICAGLSWLWFGVAASNPSTEVATRGLVSRHRFSRLFPTFSSAFSTNMLFPFRAHSGIWLNPFIWKDFHFVTGGRPGVLVRSAYYLGIGLLALFLETQHTAFADGWFEACIFLMLVSVPIDAARVFSRSLQEEIRGQTLPSLIMLPRSSTEIVYTKLAGAMLGWLPAPVIALAITLASPQMYEGIESMFRWQNGGGVLLLTILLYFALIPHFASVFALYVRWGAVALAICATIGIYFVLIMGLTIILFVLSPMWMSGGGPGKEMLLFGGAAVFFTSLCVVCHFWVLLRFPALAAR